MSRDIHMPLAIDDIEIPAGRREVVQAAVNKLAKSIHEIGLRHPVTVRRKGERYVLVAGLHRLEACKKLGREHVPALIVSMTNDEARLWEIAENLHRAELTKLERDENIAEWIKITERVSAQSAPKPQGGRPEAGIRAAARELDVDRTDATRAVKVAGISDEAKEVARETGLDNNRSALLKVAASAPDQQVAKIYELKNLPKAGDGAWRVSFERLWNKASPDDRKWARDFIDQPVMMSGGTPA